MGRKKKTKKWSIRLDGRETAIEAEWSRSAGSIWVDGKAMESWTILFDAPEHHHVLRLGRHRVIVHFRRENGKGSFLTDLSVDGISVANGQPVKERKATPVSEIEKVWKIRLDDGEHEVYLRHQNGMQIEILLDDRMMEKSFVIDRHSDHLFCLGRHVVGVHIRRLSEYESLYDLSIDGVSQDTGEEMEPFTLMPVDRCDLRVWEVNLNGKLHRVELIHPLTRRMRVQVNGKPVTETGSAWKMESVRIPFRIEETSCEIRVGMKEKGHLLLDLLVEGVSATTGQSVPDLWGETVENGRTNSCHQTWIVTQEGKSHEVTVQAEGQRIRILLNGREVHKHTMLHALVNSLKNDSGLIWFPLPLNKADNGVLLESLPEGPVFRLYLDGKDADNGESLSPLYAMCSDLKTRMWVFADREGRTQRVEVRQENWRWTHTVWVNGHQVGKFSWWRNKEIALPLGNLEARLMVKQDFANHRTRYALVVEDQVVKRGEELDFSRTPGYRNPVDPFPSEPFRERVKKAVSMFLGLVAFQLVIRWLSGEHDHPVSKSLFFSFFMALSCLFESRRAWILALIGLTLILIGAQTAYDELLKPWVAGL
ncbi:hypothetical protein [Polycladomyces subterraneus]|uniref:Galectin domain-containing protein n=1 Tax=Polycladomyces subterraneus TaxID=1016997 RepID=A0ABT8IMN4_9BACL|nr:hypothetical protein [Polycladomyces subterraneus]MDN4594051.1 hypothetical protein [Polycladomyces subterraneus]